MNNFLFRLGLFVFQLLCYAEGAEKAVVYDVNGNIAKKIVPHVGEVAYAYDPIQRLSAIQYPSGAAVKYEYDCNSNLISVADCQRETSYSYDALNRLIKAQLPGNVLLAYEYDPANRLTKIVYPDKEEIKYDYDQRGRLSCVIDQSGSTRYEYDDVTNLVVKEHLPNGIVTEYAYDACPRVACVAHKTSDGMLIAEYRFTHDGNNNCTSVQTITPFSTTTVAYSYDKLGRLIEAMHSDRSFEKYVYDGAGNRLAKITQNGTVGYEYDQHNRLKRSGDATFEYDASGNLVKKTFRGQETIFRYDPAGRLIFCENGRNKVSFAYDGEGRRVSKTVNGKTTSYINDPATPLSRVLLERDSQGNTTKRYVYGLSRIMQQGVGGTRFFLYNHPGKSVEHLVDQQQCLLKSYSYSAFGCKIDGSSCDNPYGYAGEEYDEETGLIYLRNRYYDPEMGRFISPDPVLGILGDPQTLNPYVYVRNNPVNLIDPSGLYAQKVPLTFYGNFPRARTPSGKSRAGHGWIGGVDPDGNEWNQGAWPDAEEVMSYTEHLDSLCKETVNLTVWVTPEQQLLARQAGNYPKWTLSDNCIDHVVKSLDAIGYPHPSFKSPGVRISCPTLYCDWLIEESSHINPRFVLSKDDMPAPGVLNSPQFRHMAEQYPSILMSPNYGGISLSKTAELMTNIADIAGAVFDEKTGQMILYGTKDLSLPYMHLDDLAVAVRSVYGLGSKPEQDPGISMDPDPNPPKKKKHPQMIVSYYGATKNTRFGEVMFEADRLLKNLILGVDNLTGKKCKAHLSGYKDLLALYAQESRRPPDHTWRMWFVPEKISLLQSTDGNSMVFDEVRMQVLTESKFTKGIYQDLVAERFAAHFTSHYDSYAHEFPVLHDLKRLGKITGIVKWIKEQNLPFDLSFFKSYTPQYVSTPDYTPQVCDVEYGIIICGGVIYHLDDQNFFATSSREVDAIKDEILQARTHEEELTWDFGRGYTAVAQTFGKTLKVGDVKKTFVDMQLPVPGNIPLVLVRTYDSFNDQRSGFGMGWDESPARLYFSKDKQHIRFSDGSVLKVYSELFVRLAGIESLYRIVGLDAEKRPLYRADQHTATLIEQGDGTFALARKYETLLFAPEGRLLNISDQNGLAIDYGYLSDKLVSISYQGKQAIHLEYEGSKIVRVIGSNGKVIYYDYTSDGQLQEVSDKEGTLETYAYDGDLRLAFIFDARGNEVFAAHYDIYNRAANTVVGGVHMKQEFNLSERLARIEGDNEFFIEQQFDEKYRPQKIVDALGRRLELSYAGSFGPSKTIDNNGVEVLYEYDAMGHPVKIQDHYRGERRFVFDARDHLIEEIDGAGTKTVYVYDEKGRLIKIYRPLYFNSVKLEHGKLTVAYDERFATSFTYDPLTGSVLAVDFPGGERESFKYDENGLPIEVCRSDGLVSKRSYDDRARLIELCEKGRAIRYTYDERDRVTNISLPFGDLSYSYDQKGNVVSKTDASGSTTVFAYDENDNLVQVKDALGGISSYTYSDFGALTKIVLPNSSIREIEYDEFARPVGLK